MVDKWPPCVRREWLYRLSREFQLFGSVDRVPSASDVLATIEKLPARTPVEALIVRGLLAELAAGRGIAVRAWLTAEAVIDPILADKARAYIDHHYAEHLTIARLARVLRVSPSHLTEAFRARHRTTVHAYLTLRRTDAALAALRGSDAKVEAIAAESGYRSKKDLYRVVRAATGMTPAQVRRRRQRCG